MAFQRPMFLLIFVPFLLYPFLQPTVCMTEMFDGAFVMRTSILLSGNDKADHAVRNLFCTCHLIPDKVCILVIIAGQFFEKTDLDRVIDPMRNFVSAKQQHIPCFRNFMNTILWGTTKAKAGYDEFRQFFFFIRQSKSPHPALFILEFPAAPPVRKFAD